MKLIPFAALFLAPVALVAGGAWALTGDAEAGHTLAARWCAVCHEVEASPQHAPDVPPTFAAIAANPATTEQAIKVWMQTSHPSMPNLRLTGEETNDVAAYILSLRKK